MHVAGLHAPCSAQRRPCACLLLTSTTLTCAQAFVVVLGGLSALQSRATSLALFPQQRALYIEQFQSGNQARCPLWLLKPGA